ncbi:MAG: hypothetical protein HQ581_15390 [Planctomycetes bacterium]|nr:hypothetical protein [Planctomycetota bacterium]
MIDEELLGLLVCPEDQSPLALAEEPLMAQVNRVIATGQLKNRAGRVVDAAIEAALVRQDGTLLYPIVDGIPVMLIEEAIPVDQLEGPEAPSPKDPA